MNIKLLVILILSLCCIVKSTTPTSSNYGFLYSFTQTSDPNQTVIIYDINTNKVSSSALFSINYYIITVLDFESTSNSFTLLAMEPTQSTYFLLSCTMASTYCNNVASVQSDLSYSDAGSPYLFIDKVVYIPIQNESEGENFSNFFTLLLDFNSGTAGLVALNTLNIDKTSEQSPVGAYDSLNNVMNIAYFSSNSGNGNGQRAINVLTYDLTSPTSTQQVYENIQGVTDFEFAFTDSSNQLYLLGWSNDTIITDGWLSVCRVNLVTLNCQDVYSINLGFSSYPFNPYFVSQDGQHLVFVTFKDKDPNNGLLTLSFLDINNGFSLQTTTISNQWNSTTALWNYFLY